MPAPTATLVTEAIRRGRGPCHAPAREARASLPRRSTRARPGGVTGPGNQAGPGPVDQAVAGAAAPKPGSFGGAGLGTSGRRVAAWARPRASARTQL